MVAGVTGIILAGGKGTRMDSVNKGLTTFAGKPLIEHVLERLEPQVDQIIISANHSIDEYQRYGYRVVSDTLLDQGPLSGISAVSTFINTEFSFITACDMPYLSKQVVHELMKRQTSEKPHLAIAPIINGKLEPLASLVSTLAFKEIEGQIQKGERSVLRWLKTCDVQEVELPEIDEESFVNLNTRQELQVEELRNPS